VNVTLRMLQQRTSTTEVLEGLVARYGLSRRQAYRYLREAQQATSPLPVPESKSVFTVKLPRSLILEVRRRARHQCCSIGLWVERALRLELERSKGHG
jgi:hypothetical protein